MREIRFRAWHKDANQMLFDQKHGDCLRWYSEGQPVEVMQYTGLEDRAGNEVYEGDIIHIGHPHKGRTYTGPIVYDRHKFTAENFHFTHHDEPENPFESIKYLEVIGNIYEHPHLLKGEEV